MLASNKADIDTIKMDFLNNYIERFELDEGEVLDIRGWSPEEIGPILDFDEMSEEAYKNYHQQVPLSPEAEEMLAALTVGIQVEKINAQIYQLTVQRNELLEDQEEVQY